MVELKRVLIVGAGLAGISLAVSLRRRGLDPDIVERQAAWPAHGAGIYLVGNAMRALRALGTADAVFQQGSTIQRQVLMNFHGRKLAEINTESVWAPCGPCVGVRRADLQSVLVDALGDAKVQFGTSITSLDQRNDGVVVRLSDGDERQYQLAVGADGVHSSVRKRLFPGSRVRYCGQVGWRFIAPCPPGIDHWTLFAGKGGVFLFIPVGHGQAYCYADAAIATPIADPLEGRLERLRARFAHYVSPVPETLAELKSPGQIHFGAIEEVLQHPCAAGCVFLIGDAAHATSPNMASGAAMAFEDSLVLSELVTTGKDVTQVIHEYFIRRLPRVRWVHEQTQRRDRIRNLPPFIRDLLTRLLAERVYRANYLPLVEQF